MISNVEDVWKELVEISPGGFTPGQTLYFRIPGICKSELLFDPWAWEMIKAYTQSTEYNLPIALKLDDADAEMLDCFDIIKQEARACQAEFIRRKNASGN